MRIRCKWNCDDGWYREPDGYGCVQWTLCDPCNGTGVMEDTTMKKTKLDIPTDWPRPWTEIGEGKIEIMKRRLLAWKRFKRPAKFRIYGVARSNSYIRIWYGKKVLHFRLSFKRIKK